MASSRHHSSDDESRRSKHRSHRHSRSDSDRRRRSSKRSGEGSRDESRRRDRSEEVSRKSSRRLAADQDGSADSESARRHDRRRSRADRSAGGESRSRAARGSRLVVPEAWQLDGVSAKSRLIRLQRFFIAAFPLIALPVIAYFPVFGLPLIWPSDTLLASDVFQSQDGILTAWVSVIDGAFKPLTWALLWFEKQLSLSRIGFGANIYRFTNVVLHGLSALMLWRILRRLRVPFAWVTAVAFAVHPMFLTAVGRAAGQGAALATFFALAAAAVFVRHEAPTGREHAPRGCALAGVFYAFALLAHPALMLGFPFVLVLIMWWRRRSGGGIGIAHFTRCWVFFAMAFAGLVAIYAARFLAATGDGGRVGWFRQVAEAAHTSGFIARQALAPLEQSIMYPLRTSAEIVSQLLPVVVLVAVLAVLWAFRQRRVVDVLFVNACLLLVGLAPLFLVSDYDLFRMGVTAPDWGYPAAMAVLLAVVPGVGMLCRRVHRVWCYVLAALVLGGTLAGMSYRQAGEYQKPVVVWQRAASLCPDSWVAQQRYGKALVANESYDEALPVLQRALGLVPEPEKQEVHALLSVAAEKTGRLQLAREHKFEADWRSRQAAKDERTEGLAALDGEAPSEGLPAKDIDASLEEFLNITSFGNRENNTIMRYESEHFHAAGGDIEAGLKAFAAGRYDEAANHARTALAAGTHPGLAYYLLAGVAYRQQKWQEAVKHCEAALDENVTFGGPFFYLGSMVAGSRRYRQALQYFQLAFDRCPPMVEAYHRAAEILLSSGNTQQSLDLLQAAINWNSDFKPALDLLARIRASHPNVHVRDGKTAIQVAERLCLLSDYSNPAYLATLAAAYAEHGFFGDATKTMEKAIRITQQKGGGGADIARMRDRLEAFQNEQPYHAGSAAALSPLSASGQ